MGDRLAILFQIADHESSIDEDSLRDVTDCFILQKIIQESDEVFNNFYRRLFQKSRS